MLKLILILTLLPISLLLLATAWLWPRYDYLLRDSDGARYLYYVGAGEKAIGVARVKPDRGTSHVL